MAVFAVTVAAGDIIKYQLFVYGSFVWGIHVRYNKLEYFRKIKFTPDRRQSKTLILSTNADKKSLETEFQLSIVAQLSPDWRQLKSGAYLTE